jgi:hypothetical protein
MQPEEISTSDSGMAKDWEASDHRTLFVRIHSYSEKLDHTQFDALLNKRVRITIEVLE